MAIKILFWDKAHDCFLRVENQVKSLNPQIVIKTLNHQIGKLLVMSSAGSNGEETPLKKKASLQLLPQTTISSLPDYLILSCLARVSRLYYPTLSLVSKKFRRLLASPKLYKVRSLLRRAEFCLHVCLRFHGSDPDPRWFCRKPNGKKKKKRNSGGYALATIPISHAPRTYSEVLVAVGSNIYAIGGSTYNALPSSSVSILDCRSHTWHEAPSMRVERNYGNANVADGKIYVAGGCQDKNDPKIQTWETVFCPVAERFMSCIKSAVIEGEIFMFGNHKGLAYKPKEDRWTWLGGSTFMDIGWECPSFEWSSYCVIDNIQYCYSRMPERGLVWYDSNRGFWVDVIGLRGLPKIPKYSCLRLVCYGRRMVVLWDKNICSSGGGGNYKRIWCAVIELFSNNNEVRWGHVESLDEDVLTVPSSYKFVCGLTATL